MIQGRTVVALLAAVLAVSCSSQAPFVDFVVTDNGTPVTNAQLVLHPSDLKQHDHHDCETYSSDSQGRVRIEKLSPGSYELVVFHPQYIVYQKQVTVAEKARIECPLTLGGRVTGTVTDERKNPVSKAMVRAIDPNGLVEFRNAETDANGRFTIEGLPIQPIRLYVHSGWHRPANYDVVGILKSGDTATAHVTVLDGKKITGRVIDVHGHPIPGATIGCTDEGALFYKTGPDGTFVLGGLGDAPVNMYGYKGGLAPHHLKQIAPGTSDLTLVLRPAATIRGHLEWPAQVTGGITVGLYRDDLRVAAFVLHPTHTKFEFKDLTADRYVLVVEGSAARMEISVTEGESRDLGCIRLPNPNILEEGEKR
jgi:hypothetical protein